MKPITIDERVEEILKDEDLRWRFIEHELLKRGSDFARVHFENVIPLHKILKTKTNSNPLAEMYLSEALGIEAHELFPERYDKYQLPIVQRES